MMMQEKTSSTREYPCAGVDCQILFQVQQFQRRRLNGENSFPPHIYIISTENIFVLL